MRGILLYTFEHYQKNDTFAKEIQERGKSFGLDIDILFTSDLRLTIEEGRCQIYHKGKLLSGISFGINRTRNPMFSVHLERSGIPCFNREEVTRICNDKILTHQTFSHLSAAPTTIWHPMDEILHYPCVMKHPQGYGGSEVYLLQDATAFESLPPPSSPMVVQPLAGKKGHDLRIYIVGNRIEHAILRRSDTSFRANFSLGGSCERYTLGAHEEKVVNEVLSFMAFDYVGVDFLLGDDGLLFNEIEDVVGARMLYSLGIDILPAFFHWIHERLTK